MAIFRTKMRVSILTDYPGVVTGTLANNTARAANRTAINAAIVDAWTNGYALIAPPGRYEIHGGAIIMANSYQTFRGDQNTQFVQYQLDSPCFHVGPPIGTAGQTIEGITLDGFYLRHNGTGTATVVSSALVGGHGLELTGAFLCNFKNLQIGDANQGASGATSVPYCGVYCDPRSGTIPCFSNTFENIRCKNFVFSGWHQFRNAYDAATGNVYSNIYISGGGAGDIRDISAVDGIPAYFGSLAQSAFNQFNIEWTAAKTAMHMEVCRACSFNSLNVEGITLKNTGLADSGIISMYQSNAAFQGTMIQNVTMTTANNVQNPSVFRLNNNSFVSVDTLYPILNTKTGPTNFALFSNWDPAGNSGCFYNLHGLNLGDSDQLDLIDRITFSAGNDGARSGIISDFNNNTRLTTTNADQTLYSYRMPAVVDVPAATSTKNVTLSRQASATIATRIPPGTMKRIKASSSSTVQVKNYEATNLGAAIASGATSDFIFDGTNWLRVSAIT